MSVHLSDHDDCANVVRQGEAEVTIKGEDGADALHMSSPDASQDYTVNPAFVIVRTGVTHWSPDVAHASNPRRAMGG